MGKLAAVILSRNEAGHIKECIESVSWADMVMLSDSYSDDGTVDIAKGLGALICQHPFINFSVQRNISLQDAGEAGAEWVFFIDADERCTQELAQEIRAAILADEYAGYWIPRYNIMWGHRLKGGGWYPDCQLRLLDIQRAHYDPNRNVHELAELDGEAGLLHEHLLHYNYTSLTHFKQKQERYSAFEARSMFEEHIQPHPWTYLSMPIREFLRRYYTLKGYRDGVVGLQICLLMAWYKFRAYWQLRQIYRKY